MFLKSLSSLAFGAYFTLGEFVFHINYNSFQKRIVMLGPHQTDKTKTNNKTETQRKSNNVGMKQNENLCSH